MQLRDAIHDLTPEARWVELLKFTHGNQLDAINALSGRWVGKMALTSEIASKNLYAERERAALRTCQKLCRQIIDDFESLRRDGTILLKGCTTKAPTRFISIPCDLPLQYDFQNNQAHCRDLRFHRITVTQRSDPSRKDRFQAVADAPLEVFFRRFVAKNPAPSMAESHAAAKQEFIGKHISRARIRQLHQKLIPAAMRRPGPRKRRAD